jgi:hypothetical protein
MQSRRPKRADQLPRGELVSGGYQEGQIQRGPYRPYARDHLGEEPAIESLYWFPDNKHLYDGVIPKLAPRRVVLFDFLRGGHPTSPWAFPTTAATRWTTWMRSSNSWNPPLRCSSPSARPRSSGPWTTPSR